MCIELKLRVILIFTGLLINFLFKTDGMIKHGGAGVSLKTFAICDHIVSTYEMWSQDHYFN